MVKKDLNAEEKVKAELKKKGFELQGDYLCSRLTAHDIKCMGKECGVVEHTSIQNILKRKGKHCKACQSKIKLPVKGKISSSKKKVKYAEDIEEKKDSREDEENKYESKNDGLDVDVDRKGNLYVNGYLTTPTINSDGYREYITKDKHFLICKLVVKKFVEKYAKGSTIEHIDKNLTNDRVTNLRLISKSSPREDDSSKTKKAIPVIRYKDKDVTFYPSELDGERDTKINRCTIGRKCENGNSDKEGYFWMFQEELSIIREYYKENYNKK